VPAADKINGPHAVLSSSSHFFVLGCVRVNPHAGQHCAVSDIAAEHSLHLIKAISFISQTFMGCVRKSLNQS